MTKGSILFVICFFTIITQIKSQEYLLPIGNNSVKSSTFIKPYEQKSNEQAEYLLLPFFDDFSHKGPYPDHNLWADSFVFINNSFGYNSKTIGVATFDALNQFGKVYEAASTNSYQFIADHLTSLPIRLDSVFHNGEPQNLSPADSVMISFYYQPQGKGIAPVTRDSLVLQFYKGPDSKESKDDGDNNGDYNDELSWKSVWSTTGETLEDFIGEASPYFRRVIVAIDDEEFFRNDFQFRFRNYASFPADKTPSNFAGNTSIWNIDYVYLNAGRSVADTFYYDIAFVEPAQSLLKNYTAMPWNHYIINPANYLRNNFDVVFTNLDNTTYNYSYRYYITDENNNLIRNYSGGTWNIAPFHEAGYQDYPPHTNPILITNPLPIEAADNRTFYIYHVVREGATGDGFQRNDTIVYKQEFSSFYAYDDGVPEAGYGLSGWEPQGAYRFVIPKEDVLSSVSFFFNNTKAEQNQKPFVLKVWNSLDPEEVLYESDVLVPEFEDGSFVFVDYPLQSAVLVADTFYVGWAQLTSDFINIGFDINNDAGDNIFFNVDGHWQQSMFSGALMIRPFFDRASSINQKPVVQTKDIYVYPNPATNTTHINIKISEFDNFDAVIEIFNTNGKVVKRERYSEQIHIGDIAPGVYFLRIVNAKHNYKPARLIVLPR